MLKICWPNAASLFLSKPSDNVSKIRTRLCTTPEKETGLGDISYLDELFVRINGQQQYLWRAVDQDGDVIDILLQSRRDQSAAQRFLRRLVRGQDAEPFRMVTDKLKSYSAAKRTVLPKLCHGTSTNHRLLRSRSFEVWRKVTAA
jgi:putative transposase